MTIFSRRETGTVNYARENSSTPAQVHTFLFSSYRKIGALAIAVLLFTTPAHAWWNTSWSKLRPVDITWSGTAQTNFQIKVTVTYDADMQADFDDIRFVDSDDTTALDYWRESYTASTSAVFWVEVPSIPGNKTIYMYYGNAGVSTTSSGSATFEYYQDFEGMTTGSINGQSGWVGPAPSSPGTTPGQIKNTNAYQGSKQLEHGDTAGGAYTSIRTGIGLGNGRMLEAFVNSVSMGPSSTSDAELGIIDNDGQRLKLATRQQSHPTNWITNYPGGTEIFPVAVSANTWVRIRTGITTSNALYYYLGGTTVYNGTTTGFDSFDQIEFYQDQEAIIRFDQAFIRKFAGATEPTNNVGAEQSQGGGGTCSPMNVSIAATSDDAEQNTSSGAVNLTSSDLELIMDGSVHQTIGLRFAALNIDQGATISNAYVEFTAEETPKSDATTLTFHAQAADNATTFTTGTNDISGRTKTSSSVAWNSVPAWSADGGKHQSPNLAPIIQEVVNRAGWTNNNAIAIIVTGTAGSWRVANAHGTGTPALLHVECSGGGGGGGTATNYRSIGTNTGTLYNTGNASITAGQTTVTFAGGANLPFATSVGAVGQGDKLVIGAETFYILSRDSDTQVTVQTAAASTHTNAAYTISRAYNDIKTWESGRQGDLVGEDRVEVGVAYKDGVLVTDNIIIDGSTTDATHYLHLTVAPGQRHDGTAGTGFILDGTSGTTQVMGINDPYTRVEWLELRNYNPLTNSVLTMGYDTGDANNALLSHLLIHDFNTGSKGAINVYDDVTVRNTIIYNGDKGIRTQTNDSLTLTVQNVTIYNMTTGEGRGVHHANGTLVVQNTISVGNTLDFHVSSATVGGGSGNNLYSTVNASVHPGTNNQSPPASLEDLFVSIVSTSEDLHLESSGHDAIDNGLDLSGSFTDDIDGDTRPIGSGFEIGADETAGGGGGGPFSCPIGSELFSDDFEGASLTPPWDGTWLGTGTDSISLSTDVANSGSQSVKSVVDNQYWSQAVVAKDINGQTTVHAKIEFFVPTSFSTTGDVAVLRFGDGGNNIVVATLDFDMTWYIWNQVAGQRYDPPSPTTMTKNEWHTLEMQATISDTAGVVKLWLDGNLEINESGRNLGTALVNMVNAPFYWANGGDFVNTLYADDAVICGTPQAGGYPNNPIVNSTDDDVDASPGDGSCDTGQLNSQSVQECTLRAAIMEANAYAGTDTIEFDIPTSESGYSASPLSYTITPGSQLPNIASEIVIDGTSQADFTGTPVIVVNGNNLVIDGFRLASGSTGSTIRGLVINGFTDDAVEFLSGGGNSNVSIVGNFFGTNPAGLAAPAFNNDTALYINSGVDGAIIGTAAAADRNIFGYFNSFGLVTKGSNTTIQGNYFGIGADGVTALVTGEDPVSLNSATNALVGGTNPGEGNLIANGKAGVRVQQTSSNNTIIGNTIFDNVEQGVVVNGATAAGITISQNSIYDNGNPSGIGIDIDDDGVTANDTNDADAGNNGKQNYPVLTEASTTGSQITITGTINSNANRNYRIEFFANTVPTPGQDSSNHGEGERYLGYEDVTTVGNDATINATLSAVVAVGEYVTATATDLTTNDTSEFALNVTAVSGSLPPGDGVVNSTGNDPDNNTGDDVCDTGNTIGSDPECTLRAAIMQANATAGANEINFDIPTSDANYVASPLSWAITPLTALPAISDAVDIDATSQSGFSGTPIIILDGNNISADGFVLGSGADGTTIRGFIIRDFGLNGIQIQAGSDGNTIAGNYIGRLNPWGTDMGAGNENDVRGIEVLGNNNTIGGTDSANRNVISGNTGEGIIIRGGAAGTIVRGNYIGTFANGTSALGNGQEGIQVMGAATGTIIGGSAAGAGNVIAFNGATSGPGISIEEDGTDNTVVQGNFIGTDTGGTLNLGNFKSGIDVRGTSNAATSPLNTLIGGTGANEGNVIRFNDLDGIRLRDVPVDVHILGNSIFDNGQQGIDLWALGTNDNVTENDAGDGDTGANGLLNFPVITAAVENSGTIDVDYDLDVAAGDYRIEFFKNPSGGDAPANGEGEEFVDAVTITHGGGAQSFSRSFAGSAGDLITATATEESAGPTYGSTSEFSDGFTVVAPPAVTDAIAEISPNDVTTSSTGNSFSYDIAITIGGTDTGVNQVSITVPGSFSISATPVTDVLVNDVSVGAGFTDNTSGNAISVDLTTKVTASSKITIVFDADAPTSQDLTGVNFTSTVNDSGTGTAAQSATEGDGDGDAGDANSWKVTTTDDPAANLAAHWPFDEGTGQAAGDTTANNNDGVLGTTAGAESSDAAWNCVAGGYALDFDGNDDAVTVTDPGGAWEFADGGLDAGTSDFTIVAWVKYDATGSDSWPTIVRKGGGSSSNAGYWFNYGKSGDTLDLRVSDGTSRFEAISNAGIGMTDGEWHHVAAVFDREAGTDTAHFYFDGSPVGSPSSSLIANNSVSGTDELTIGRNYSGNLRPWKGKLDDPRIYSAALNSSQIAALAATAPVDCGSNPAVTSAVAEISPNDVATSSTGNAFSYDIQATIGGSDTGVNRVAITVPAGFTNVSVTGVQVNGSPVAYTNNTVGNAISVDLTTKVTATSKITVLFSADAPTTEDLTGVNFTSTVDDSSTGNAAQSTAEGNGDGDAGDANSWKVTTTDGPGNLIGHWEFNEGTGQTAGDSSPSNNDGTLGPTGSVESEDPSWACSGTALDFDGNNQEVKLGNVVIGDSAEWTISAWIKIGADTADKRTIYSEGNTGTRQFLFLYVDDTANHVDFYSESAGAVNTTKMDGTTNVETDTWQLVTVVQRSKIDRELYVGTNSEDTDAANAGTLTFNSAQVGYLRTNAVSDPFKGLIDNVRIYDYALSPAEIAALAASPPAGCAPTLTTNYRSIGTNAGILYSTGTASINSGTSTVTFGGGASLPVPTATGAVGQGDKLIIGADTFHILSRDSATQVTVQETAGSTLTNQAYTIQRAFNTPQAWETARQGNLVSENRQEVGVAYADGAFTGPTTQVLQVLGSTTDATHFMELIVAQGQRHDGTAASGVIFDGADTTKHGVRINDDYTRIQGLEIKRFRSENGAAGIFVDIGATNVLLEDLLIYDFDNGSASIAGIQGKDASSFTARNCIIFDGDTAGIRGEASGAGVIENCTIQDMAVRGVWEDGATFTVTNTISMDSSTGFDFSVVNGTQSYNISSDTTAAGTGSLTSKVAANQFVSITVGSEDLHLKAGADAINAGTTLGGFSIDIDGDARPVSTQWEIGADETSAAGGGGGSLIAHWEFDEGSGQTAADSSGNGYNAMLGNSAGADSADPSWECVVGGNALKFYGVDDYLDATDIDVLDGATEVTVSAWVKMEVVSAYDAVIRKGSGSNVWQFRTGHAPGTKLRASIGGQTPDGQTPAGIVTAGTWARWTMVFDGDGATNADRLKIYLNGSNQTLDFFSGDIPSALPDTGTQPVTIGQHDFFNGVIDDVRIYDYPLSAGEIAALAATPPVDCAPAVTSALAEISPNNVLTSSTSNSFSYDIDITINGGDTGVNVVEISAPGSFSNVSVTGVEVDGTPVAYTNNSSGNNISVTLTAEVASSSRITVLFDADAPTSEDLTGVNFTSRVDDSTSTRAPQATTEGDGDGDAGDNNSWTVTTTDAVGGSCPSGNTIFSNSFESGDFSAWTATETGTGDTITASTVQANSGSYSARADINNVADSRARVALDVNETTLSAKTYFYLDPAFAISDVVEVMYFKGATQLLGAKIKNDMTLWLRNNLVGEDYISTATISKGAWHSLEMQAVINGTNSEGKLWLDGNLVLHVSGIDLGTDPITRFTAGWHWGWPQTEANILYVDDVTLCEVAMGNPGPSPTTNYRSIGTNSGTLYNTGNASISSGTTTVTFAGGASLPLPTAVGAVGQGDKLVIGGETFYILSRDSATQVTVQTAAASTHTNAAYAITRAYNDFASWESGQQGTGNLVGENRIEVGVAYKDGVFAPTSDILIDGYTTDANHYLHLTVAPGQRHNGTAGTGVIIDGGSSTKQAFGVRHRYTRIEWLEIRNFNPSGGNSILTMGYNGDASNSLLSHLIIHDYVSGDKGAINVYDDVTVRNTIIYNADKGIRTQDNASLTLTVQNATIYNMSGIGVHHQAGTLAVQNTISVGNTIDFDVDTDPIDGSSGNNLYATVDASVHPGTNNQSPPASLDDLFISVAPSAEDLHLESSGHDAIDTGADLSGNFTVDIDDESRPLGSAWDIGADEADGSGSGAGGTCPASSIVFSDGFESGDLSAWTSSATGSGDTITASTVQALTGTYSARAQVDNVADAKARVLKNFAGQTTVSVRAWFYLDPTWSTSDNVEVLYFVASADHILAAHIREDMTLQLWNEWAGENYATSSTVSIGEWHSIEMEAVINGTSSEARLWLDGEMLVQKTGIDLGTAPITRLDAGWQWSGAQNEANTLYMDDVVVCDQPIGAIPGASANVLIIASNKASPTASDLALEAHLEALGLTIFYADDDDAEYNTAIAANNIDVVYISASSFEAKISPAKVGGLTVGVVTANEGNFDDSDLASDRLETATTSNIIDNSHFITSPFSTGSFTAYTSSGTLNYGASLGVGAQILAQNPADPTEKTLIAYEIGTSLKSYALAPARRVGVYTNADFSQWTNMSKEIVYRSLIWASEGNPVACKVMLIVGNSASPSASDQGIYSLLTNTGMTVTYADDGDSVATYNSIISSNSINVAYMSESSGSGNIGTKMQGLDIGVVVANNGSWTDTLLGTPQQSSISGTYINVVDNSHYITSPYSTGNLAVYLPSGGRGYTQNPGSGGQVLAQNPTDVNQAMILAYDTGGQLSDSSPAPARRVGMFSDDDYSLWSSIAQGLVVRSVHWAGSCSGATTAPAATDADAEISPNDVATSSTGNAFSYDIQATIGGGGTGVNRVAITVPVDFSNVSVANVHVNGSPVGYTNNTVGNAISVDLTTKVTVSSRITVLFTADAPTAEDLTGVDFLSTVDDSSTSAAAQSTTEGNGDGDSGDANSWTVTTTDAPDSVTSASAEISPNNVTTSSTANAFSYDIQLTIGGGDTGVNRVTIAVPGTFGAPTITAVQVNGGGVAYNNGTSGNDIIIDLNIKVTASSKITVLFTADAPTSQDLVGVNFTSTVDDTATTNVAARSTTQGNGDGDAGDNNSWVVTTTDAGGFACPIASNIFSDGFESGNFNAWDGTWLGNGGDSLTVSTDQANTGTYSAKAVSDTTNPAQASVIKFINDQTTIHVKAEVFIPSSTSPATDIAVIELRGGGVNIISATLNNDMTWFMWNDLTGLWDAYGWSAAMSKDEWHTIEMRVTIAGTAGEARLWIDGNLEIEALNKNIGTTPIDSVLVPFYWSANPGGGTQSNTVYADDVAICGVPPDPAVTSAVAEISPNNVTTGSTGNAFSYDIDVTIGGSDTGVDTVAITVPGNFGAPSVTNVLVDGSPAGYSNNTAGNAISVDLNTPVTASARITVLFTADAPTSQDLTGANFLSTVDDSASMAAAQATTEGNGDGDGGDANSWTVTTTDASGACVVDPNGTYMEAENYSALVDGTNGEFLTATSQAGYNGSAYIYTANENDMSGQRADYTVMFANTGTYYAWIRGYATALNDDSIFFGYDGSQVPPGDEFDYEEGSGWTWVNGDVSVASFTVASPGEHTLNLWGRENNALTDGIYISTNSGAIPGGVSGAIPTGATVVDPNNCGSAVTSAVAEISPNDVMTGSTANAFSYDIQTTIGGGDTGVNTVAITVPGSFGVPTVTDVLVDGFSAAYTDNTSGQAISVVLTTKLTSSGKITVLFSADAPTAEDLTGVDFVSTVDDSTTGDPVQATTEGNGDGDAGDNNSWTVTTTDGGGGTVNPVVNSTGNTGDNAAGDGVCNTGGLNSQSQTECTLRAAIQEANAFAGLDTITFNIPTSEPGYSGSPLSYTITLSSALPSLSDQTVIDGSTQPGYGGTPIVIVDGNNMSASGIVFGPNADGSTVRGLIIRDFGVNGVQVQAGSDGNLIAGNYIGRLNAAGTDTGPGNENDTRGIEVLGSNTTIGGTTAADRNVISGNGGEGIIIRSGAANTIVQGNYLGVEADGTTALGNQQEGIQIDGGSPGTIIGGSAAGAGNVIGANGIASGPGITIESDGTDNTVVQGNYIGTDASGTADIGNLRSGIEVRGTGNAATSPLNTLIGGSNAGEANIIRYNDFDGIRVRDVAVEVAILGNAIDRNGQIGIDLWPAASNDDVTPNDAGDGDSGSNLLMNFPVITTAIANAGNVDVNFNLDVPAGNYRVEFFKNPSGADPSGNGEGETYVGYVNLTHGGSGAEAFSHSFAGDLGDIISATVTEEKSGPIFVNTSEFSATYTVTAGAAVAGATAEISPNNIVTSGGTYLFEYDIAATVGAANTGVDRVAITVPGTFGVNASPVTNVLVDGFSVAFTDNSVGNAISVDLAVKLTSNARITVLFEADAPNTEDLTGVDFTSTVDDSTTGDAAQAATEGNGDGDTQDANSWTVTTTGAGSGGGGGACSITVDGSIPTSTSTGSSMTISHTTSGTDRLMLVGVSFGIATSESVSSITYNGDPLTFQGARNGPGNDSRIEIWSRVAPDTGTHNVVITLSGAASDGVAAGVMTFNGVDQATPLGTFASNAGTGGSASVNVTSAAGELVFGVVAVDDGADYNLVPGAGQTEHWDLKRSEANASASTEAGAASVTTSWSWSGSDDHAVGGISIKPATGCGNAAVGTAVAEISPNNVTTSSTGNAFAYDIQATITGAHTGVNRIAITVPATFGAPTITDVLVNGVPVSYTNNTTGNDISVDLTSKLTSSARITVLFTADAPTTPDPAGKDFLSTVDDSGTPNAPQATTEGDGDGDGGDNNDWTVTTTDPSGASCDIDPAGTYIEAENYSALVSGTGPGTFSVASSQAGYNGTGYLVSSGGSSTIPPENERADYTVNFTTTGTYYVWIRGYALDGSTDSVFIGLDGTYAGALTEGGTYNQWIWTNTIQTGVNTINVATAGQHTINLWVREGNHKVDGIYITQDSGGIPGGTSIGIPTSGGSSGSFTKRVITGNDDAEQDDQSPFAMDLGSSDLELHNSGGEDGYVGMRWTGVTIPQGATITDVRIQFHVDEIATESSQALTVTFRGHDTDNAGVFTSTASDISNRTVTTASVNWAIPTWVAEHDEGAAQLTSDLSPIVQEIVDRPGWSSGNAIVIMIKAWSGSGRRTAEAYNGESASTPELQIDYTTGGGSATVIDPSACAGGGPGIDHFAIIHDGTGINCQAENVTIEAHNASHVVDTAFAGTIKISTSTNHGDWSLVTGSGSLTNGGKGNAVYGLSTADSGVVVLGLRDTFVETVNIDVDSVGMTEDASEDDDLVFARSGFNFLADSAKNTIGVQIGGKASNVAPGAQTLELQAVKTNDDTGACEAVLVGPTVIDIGFECEDPVSCATDSLTFNSIGIPANDNNAVPVYARVSMDFGTAADSTASFTMTYDDVGKIKLRARSRIMPSGEEMLGGSNSFVVRPFAFDINIGSNPGADSPAGDPFIAAGTNFSADVTALLWQAGDDLDEDGIPDNHDDTDPSNNADLTDNAAALNYGKEDSIEQILLTAALDQPSGGVNPGLSGGTNLTIFTGGTGTTTSLRYDEVGIIEISAKLADDDYLGIGATETAKFTSKSGYVGRFHPAQYAVTASDINPACSATFTYARQPFTGSMTIEAQNGDDGGNTRTQNYRAGFVTLDPNSELTFINSQTAGAYDSKTVTYNQNFDSGNTGEAILALQFRWDMPEQPPAISTVQNTAVTDEVTTLVASPVTIGSSPTRHGRAFIGTAAGSELVDLNVVMRTEYYLNSTNGYVVNLEDFCSAGATLDLTNFTDNLADGETCVQDTGMPGLSGEGCAGMGPVLERYNDPLLAGDANLWLKAPGANNDGSATITSDVPDWLEFDWDTAVPGLEDPTGHATFGIYGGDKNQIYRRELY